MHHDTLDSFSDFTSQERELLNALFPSLPQEQPVLKAPEGIIERVLAYAKTTHVVQVNGSSELLSLN